MSQEDLRKIYMQNDGQEKEHEKIPSTPPPTPERKRDDYRDNEPRPLTESEPSTIEPEKGWERE